MKQSKIYTHQVPSINSKSFLNIKKNYVGRGQIKSIDYFHNPMVVDFEFYIYDDGTGHFILRWGGNEQIVKVKFYWLYNLRMFACPLGCGRYTTELFYFNRTEWGCFRCLGLVKEKPFLRARSLARNPARLFRFLESAKRSNKKSVGIAALFLMNELFVKALKKKKRNLSGIRI